MTLPKAVSSYEVPFKTQRLYHTIGFGREVLSSIIIRTSFAQLMEYLKTKKRERERTPKHHCLTKNQWICRYFIVSLYIIILVLNENSNTSSEIYDSALYLIFHRGSKFLSEAIFNFMILQMHLKYSFFSEGSEQPSVYLNSLLELITLLKSE